MQCFELKLGPRFLLLFSSAAKDFVEKNVLVIITGSNNESAILFYYDMIISLIIVRSKSHSTFLHRVISNFQSVLLFTSFKSF